MDDERDAEGRPKARRNAGAFLGPFSGMVPVPSDTLDRHWDAAQARRDRRRTARRVLLAAATIVAVLAVLYLLTPPGP